MFADHKKRGRRGDGIVLLVIGQLGSGGAERVMSTLANFWAESRRVCLLTLSEPTAADFYRLAPEVRRIKLNCGGSRNGTVRKAIANARTVWAVRREILELKPDYIISFMTETNILVLLAATFTAIPVIVSERIDAVGGMAVTPRLWRLLRRLCYPSADAVVAQTSAMRSWLRGIGCRFVVTIPNPILLPPQCIEGRRPIVLSVGRLTEQKGHDILIRAFSQVRRRFLDWRLVIVGRGPDEAALKSLIDAVELTGAAEVHPPTPDIAQYYRSAGIFVLASRYEGFPNVLVEAMAWGLPVLSADCPSGPSDIITNEANGLLVPVENSPAIAAALQRLMSDDRLRGELGRSARESSRRFEIDRVMRRWDALLSMCASRRSI